MKSELHESQELCCRHTLELRIRQPRWSQKGDGNSCGASGCLRLLSFWPNSAAADCVVFPNSSPYDFGAATNTVAQSMGSCTRCFPDIYFAWEV